jgi:fatty acid-binding protein DegV
MIDAENDEPSWRLPESVEREELTGANHPFVTEYLAVAEEPGYDASVIVTPAVEFATMSRNAELAAELSNSPTVAFDSRTAAAGQALVVLAGAEAAAAGGDLEHVLEVIEWAARRVELVASLATLEPLSESGQVPEAVLRQLEASGTRSVFRMRDGAVEALAASASPDETLELIVACFRARQSDSALRAAVFHADVPELADRLVAMLGDVVFVSGFSLAMQVHTGRGVVGAAWLPVDLSP